RDFLDLIPIRQQPRLKIVLRSMWIEAIVLPHPRPHLCLCISSVDELICSRVHVGKRNNGIRWRRRFAQKIFDDTSEFFAHRNSAIKREEVQTRHLTREL